MANRTRHINALAGAILAGLEAMDCTTGSFDPYDPEDKRSVADELARVLVDQFGFEGSK